MRDPKRIKPLLKLLERAWRAEPDMRLGQLVWNAAFALRHSNFFYVEDEALVAEIIAQCKDRALFINRMSYQKELSWVTPKKKDLVKSK